MFAALPAPSSYNPPTIISHSVPGAPGRRGRLTSRRFRDGEADGVVGADGSEVFEDD